MFHFRNPITNMRFVSENTTCDIHGQIFIRSKAIYARR
jgi:hypothetical protein